MVILLCGVDALGLVLAHGRDIMGTEVKRPDDVNRDLTIEAKTLKANGCDLFAVFVEGTNLLRNEQGRERERREGQTDCTEEEVIL